MSRLLALVGRPLAQLEPVRLCSYTLTLALGLSVLAAGAVHLPVLQAFAVLTVLGGGLAAWALQRRAYESTGESTRWVVGMMVWVALTGVCILQCVPVPLGWLKHLAPENADIWARTLRPLDLPPLDVASVSLAPRRTLVEALKVACYAVVFGVAAVIGAERGGMQRLARMAFGLALCVALVTAGHQLVGAELLYGAYRPLDAYNVAPLLNANNLAGYLNLGFFCGLGLLFRAGMRPHAALIGLGLAFLAAEILMCESLGGSASLAIGLALVLALPRGQPGTRRSLELGRPLQAVILVIIGAGAASMAFAARRSELGLDDRSSEKLDLFSRAGGLAADHFWLGIGRGAFGTVFPARQPPGRFTYEHAENFLLQWASEWGVPVTVISLSVLAWVVRPALSVRTLSRPVHRAALVGCFVLLLQNLVDLGMEVPAQMALLCAMLGGICGASRHARAAAVRPPSRAWPLAATSGLGALCLGLTLLWGIGSPGRLRHELHAELSGSGMPSDDFWTRLRGALLAFPADPYFPMLGSSAALSAGKNPIPWVARALERSPQSSEAHMQLGRVLHARGASSQALGALRRAVELDPRQTRVVLRLGADWGLAPDALSPAAPAGPAGTELLILLAAQSKDGEARLRLLEQALEHDPARPDAHHHLAAELLRQASQKSPSNACTSDRTGCLARAREHAKRGELAASPRTGILEARILAQAGEAAEAEELLLRTCEQFASDVACADSLMVQALANESPRLQGAVTNLVALACGNRERCGETHLRLGHRFAGAGRWNVALTHFRHAAEETPSPKTWQALATAAERLGQETLAGDAKRRVGLLKAGAAEHSEKPPIDEAAPIAHPTPPTDLLQPAAQD